MVEVTPLGKAIGFLKDFGFFDIILPFLLVFTIVFGILEKTRIFGTEDGKKEGKPKKNINAMVAFSIAFFLISAQQIVSAIQISLPQVVFVLIVIVSFLMLVAAMYQEGEDFKLEKGWKKFLIFLIFFGLLAIFLNAFGWLEVVIGFFIWGWGNAVVPAIIILAVVLLVIYFIVREPKGKPSGGDE